jgi:hypothetical protein
VILNLCYVTITSLYSSIVPVLENILQNAYCAGGGAYIFLSWEIDGTEWLISRSSCFTHEVCDTGTHWIGTYLCIKVCFKGGDKLTLYLTITASGVEAKPYVFQTSMLDEGNSSYSRSDHFFNDT